MQDIFRQALKNLTEHSTGGGGTYQPLRAKGVRRAAALMLLLTFFMASLPDTHAAGNHLDFAFSSDGKLVTEFGSLFNPTDDYAEDVALQADGKIVVAGWTSPDEENGVNFAVARYHADGTLDTSFSSDGKVTTNFPGSANDYARAVAIQGDGKILVAGVTYYGGYFAIARYNTNGSLDTSFDTDGRAVINFGLHYGEAHAIAMQDDKIILAGYRGTFDDYDFALVRLNANGSLDTSFGTSGGVSTSFNDDDRAHDVRILPDGKILVAGFADNGANSDFAMARYTANGTLDTSFSSDGRVITDMAGNEDTAYALTVTSDSKLVLAGTARFGSSQLVALARYHANGSLDNTFSPDGRVFTNLGLQAVASDVLAVGSFIVVSVRGYLANVHEFTLLRYRSDGSLDPTFGTGGRVNTFFRNTTLARANAIAFKFSLSTPVRIIAVGTSLGELLSADDEFAVSQHTWNGTAARADFSADGQADFAVFRPSTGYWYVSDSASGASTGTLWGTAGDIPVPGDYDRDGITDAAVFRQGYWYILQSSNNALVSMQFGTAEDKPVQGDYDGDGRCDIAVFRPSDATWYIQRSTLGLTYMAFGVSTDKPAQGDYDGDGLADIAVFRDGTWYIQHSMLGYAGIAFGAAGDRPVPADYDGDGRINMAVFRPSTSSWHIKSGSTSTSTSWGTNGDTPAPADFDGDGKADLTVFRPSAGSWYVLQSASGTQRHVVWGTAGDVPVSSAYVPQ